MLKKLLFAAAVAATISTGVQAVGMTSNVTGAQLFKGFNNIFNTTLNAGGLGGVTQAIEIGGDTVTGLTFDGQVVFNTGPNFRVTFALDTGVRQGANGVGGTNFTGGTIVIEYDTGAG
jgi:hypothetical protein